MASRPAHQWDGREIGELPPEILMYCIKDTPRTMLKDIAIRLNKDSAGNWEALAEKLGFTGTVIDELIEKARVQSTYPGLLMLQEWAGRGPGSTALVLLHALREIQREDAVSILVDKIIEMHSLKLSVSVEDQSGVARQFFQVGTRKSAPLHASLDNILSQPLYFYDIVGPRRDLDWNTDSGQLQGSQLTLRLRGEPSQDSMEQIYGKTQQRLCVAPPNQTPTNRLSPSPGGQGMTGGFCTQLELNIPPSQPNISVTLPLGSSSHGPQVNVTTRGPVRLQPNNTNDLSGGHQPTTAQQQQQQPSSAYHRDNFYLSRSNEDLSRLPPPPVCRPSPQVPQGQVYDPSSLGPESELDFAEPMTLPANLPNLSGFHSFPELSTGLSGSDPHQGFTAPSGGAVGGGCGGDVYGDPSNTFGKEYDLCSHTGAKCLKTGSYGGCGGRRFPAEHEDMSLQNPAVSRASDSRGVNIPLPEGGPRQTGFSGLVSRPTDLGGRDQNMPFLEGIHHGGSVFQGLASPGKDNADSSISNSNNTPQMAAPSCSVPGPSSSLHPDYVAHDTVIQFCNNPMPNSPLSGGGSGPPTPQGTPQHHHHDFTQQQQQGGYVAHSVIRQWSDDFHKSRSTPNLDAPMDFRGGGDNVGPLAPPPRHHHHRPEMMDWSEEQHNSPGGVAITGRPDVGGGVGGGSLPAGGGGGSGGSGGGDTHHSLHNPLPCTFSNYRPGMVTDHVYQNTLSQHSNGGYIDMSGATRLLSHSHSQQAQADSGHPSSSSVGGGAGQVGLGDPRLRGFNSFDGYMNNPGAPGGSNNNNNTAELGFSEMSDSVRSLDSATFRYVAGGGGGGELGDVENVSRSRRPLMHHNLSEGDLFPPRDRRPVTQDHDMLLSDESSAGGYAEPAECLRDADGASSSSSSSSRMPGTPHRRKSSEVSQDSGHHRSRGVHRELSSSDLQQVPGWNPSVTDGTVEQAMATYVNEDGNFMVWRFSGGKFVISVSHLRSIRHYQVHENEKNGQGYYYIFPKGHRFLSLAQLVNDCQEKGVSEPTKTFKSPDGKETPRGSSTGGCSHVRLKTPITPRRKN